MSKYADRQIEDGRINIAALMIILLVIALIFLPRACGAIAGSADTVRTVEAGSAAFMPPVFVCRLRALPAS
jgi:hypothetical protein